MRYKLRNDIKGKVLADFVIEFTHSASNANRVYQVFVKPWQVYVDGASNAWGAEIGQVLVSPKGIKLNHSLRLGFWASNNEAKYD